VTSIAEIGTTTALALDFGVQRIPRAIHFLSAKHDRPALAIMGNEGVLAVNDDEFAYHVRHRAYELWELAGRPDGKHFEFWELAEKEMKAKRLNGGIETDEAAEAGSKNFKLDAASKSKRRSDYASS
jgi:hypothetical protein